VFVFGWTADDVFVGSTAGAAAEHVRAHLDDDEDPRDFEIFDFDGTPLAYSVADDTFAALRPWEYLQGRMQVLAGRIAKDPGPDPQEAHLSLLKGLAEGDAAEFAALALDLASRTRSGAHAPVADAEPASDSDRVSHPHTGSPLHNACHRMHLCD
jgi:hypothetical protein